jgi:hypothetical protein
MNRLTYSTVLLTISILMDGGCVVPFGSTLYGVPWGSSAMPWRFGSHRYERNYGGFPYSR